MKKGLSVGMIMDFLKGLLKPGSDTETETPTKPPSSDLQSEQFQNTPPWSNSQSSAPMRQHTPASGGMNQQIRSQGQFAIPMIPQGRPQQRGGGQAPGFRAPSEIPRQARVNPTHSPFGRPLSNGNTAGFGRSKLQRQAPMYNGWVGTPQQRYAAPQRLPNGTVLHQGPRSTQRFRGPM